MAKPTGWTRISGYLFLLGVIIAIIAGILGANIIPYSSTILVVLGTLVGLLAALGMGSISRDAAETLLLATVALLVTSIAGQGLLGLDGLFPGLGTALNGIVSNIAVFIAPAVVILALEAIWRAGSVKF